MLKSTEIDGRELNWTDIHWLVRFSSAAVEVYFCRCEHTLRLPNCKHQRYGLLRQLSLWCGLSVCHTRALC